jgi:hypothetical protein
MALITLLGWKTQTGETDTDATRDAAIALMIAEVEKAIIGYLGMPVEQATYTRVLDAPVRQNIVLPYSPVTLSGLQVWMNTDAKGDPSAFTSSNLLTLYTDYSLVIDQPDGTSKSGIIRKTAGVWAFRHTRPVERLSPVVTKVPGAIKVTFTAGYATVPADIQAAAYLMVSKLYTMRKLGGQLQNESLNGYSYGLAGNATAGSIIADPTVVSMLRPYKGIGTVDV